MGMLMNASECAGATLTKSECRAFLEVAVQSVARSTEESGFPGTEGTRVTCPT